MNRVVLMISLGLHTVQTGGVAFNGSKFPQFKEVQCYNKMIWHRFKCGIWQHSKHSYTGIFAYLASSKDCA